MRCIFRTNKVTPYVCSYLFHFGIQAKMLLWMSSKPCFSFCNDFTKSPPGRMPLGIFSGLKYPRTFIRSPEGWAWGWSTFRALCKIACRPSNRLCGIVFCVHSTPFPLIRWNKWKYWMQYAPCNMLFCCDLLCFGYVINSCWFMWYVRPYYLGSFTTDVRLFSCHVQAPTKFWNDMCISTPNLAESRLCEILWLDWKIAYAWCRGNLRYFPIYVPF